MPHAADLLACPKCGTDVDFEHSYHEDDNRYPRDFWHVRVRCGGCGMVDTGWEIYGNQEQRVPNVHIRQDAERSVAAQWNTRLATAPVEAAGGSVDMILHCPRCRMHHIDEPDHEAIADYDPLDVGVAVPWTNPPHRSHLCHGCGCIWRPADVATNGVREITTKGKADNWKPSPPVAAETGREAVEALARLLVEQRGCSPDTLHQHDESDDLPVDARRDYVDPFTHAQRTMLMHKAWRKRVPDAMQILALIGRGS